MPLNTVYKEPQKQTIIHSAPSSLLFLYIRKKDLIAMKVLILACLLALALAREKEEFIVSGETVKSLSSSEESVTHINEKIEKFKHEEQQQTEDERQDKIHHFSQPQPLVYSYTGPIPYPILPKNILPLAQPPVVVPFPQPEIMKVPKAKENILPKHKEMRFPKSPVEPFIESQSLTLTDLENLHLPLSLLQSLMHQPPHRLPPTLMFPPQPLQSLSQPKVLPIPQQVVPYLQRDMPIQTLLLYQEPVLGPIQGLYPVIV
ncbi:beta-casein [Phocoena phocoena]